MDKNDEIIIEYDPDFNEKLYNAMVEFRKHPSNANKYFTHAKVEIDKKRKDAFLKGVRWGMAIAKDVYRGEQGEADKKQAEITRQMEF